jgi:hypothetical protein
MQSSPVLHKVEKFLINTVGSLIMARFAEIYVRENWRCSLHRLDRVALFFSSKSWFTQVGIKVEIKYLSLKGREGFQRCPKLAQIEKSIYRLKI